MLIDVSYFTYGPRQIENASTVKMPLSGSLSVNEAIDGYIKSFQYEYLLNMTGKKLAGEITDYLDLVEKNEPVDPGNESAYEMLCEKLRESFADYVFYYILRDMNHKSTMTGLVRLKCANTYIAPIKRQVSIWNSMVNKNRLFVEWAKGNSFEVEVNKNLLTCINSFNL